MGLRNGEALNALCPGRNGPSDIDHVIHNMHVDPERLMFLEYKDAGVGLTAGQEYLRRSLTGDWEERSTGRLMSVRFYPMHPADAWKLPGIVEWVWPDSQEKDGAALCPGFASMTSTRFTAR